jgi:nicotinamide mononucleotide transporter
MTYTEIFGALTGLICVWLTVRENVWNWPIGLVNNVFFFVLFFGAKLYADAGLQVFFFVLGLYGWWQWLHGGQNDTELSISRTQLAVAGLLGFIALAGTAAMGTMLARYTDAALPFCDSSIAVLSLIAQWMLARKLLENWLVWITVDVISVGVYLTRHLYLTAGLYAVFLVLATLGYFAWKRTFQLQSARPQPATQPA